MRTHFITLIALVTATALAPLTTGCKNPADDKTKAIVTAPSTPTAAPAPTPAPTPAPAATRKLTFSGDGSEVGFTGSKVTGSHTGGFKQFAGVIELGDKLESGKVTLEIDVASLFTDAEKLTGHLLSPDFFDAAKFPKATFTSMVLAPQAENPGMFTVSGDLDLHGVKKGLQFPATITADGANVSVRAEFVLNRKDFGIVYPGKPDDLIRDEIVIRLAIVAKPAAN